MNDIATTQQNPFGNAPVAAMPKSGNAVAMSDQSRAIAEVQAAMMIARMNPRDPIYAMDRILNACSRPTLANVAVYQYARGGNDISGPSIRLAEAMAQAWGNLQFGIRELDQRNGESTVQAFAWDVETNTRREVTFQIPHKRYTRKGSYQLEDPRDIYEMVANQGARRLRACILAIIPGDVVEAAVNQCELTMKAKADTSPESLKKMIAAFEPFGITKEQIEKRIQRRLDAIQPAQMVSLQKIYISLRDGMSTASDWFEQEEGVPQPAGVEKTATESLKAKLNGKQSAREKPEHITPKTNQKADFPSGEAVTSPSNGEDSNLTVTENATVQKSNPRPENGISATVQKFMREINQASEKGAVGVDQWRAKHNKRAATECGGIEAPDYGQVMEYAQMTYQACADSEKEMNGGEDNGKLF